MHIHVYVLVPVYNIHVYTMVSILCTPELTCMCHDSVGIQALMVGHVMHLLLHNRLLSQPDVQKAMSSGGVPILILATMTCM